jgi:hypothetical protein
MSNNRDERPIGEIHFAQDVAPMGGDIEAAIRVDFLACGCKVGQDIIDLGCTGLALKLQEQAVLAHREGFGGSSPPSTESIVQAAEYIRKNMAGSVCGLPCYVPRDRFCLVHNTVGGLQVSGNFDGPQPSRHPEALSFMSRELTEEEQKKVAGINAKLAADAKEKALAEYGAEEIEDEATLDSAISAPSCPIPQPPFKCPDHKEPDWDCRKCIAQAIAEGTDSVVVELHGGGGKRGASNGLVLGSLTAALADIEQGNLNWVSLFVRAASWSKKVTRD